MISGGGGKNSSIKGDESKQVLLHFHTTHLYIYTYTMKFLKLANEVSQPFVIPNVSPTSSPNLVAQELDAKLPSLELVAK